MTIIDNNKFAEFDKNFTATDWDCYLIRAGFKRAGNKSYTRPGKETGVSCQIYNYNGVWLLKNYSTSLNFVTASKSGVISPSNFITDYLFNGDRQAFYNDIRDEYKGTTTIKKRETYDRTPEENTGKNIFTDLVYNEQGERLFHISINKNTINKEYNKYKANNFKNEKYTVNELIKKVIGKGYLFLCGHLKGIDGELNSKRENYLCGDLIAIDIDDNMTITEALNVPMTNEALLLYTTTNHTKEKHRFRLLFPLHNVYFDFIRLMELSKDIIDCYGADRQANNPNRTWFSNNNAKIIDIQNETTYLFNNGKCYEVRYNSKGGIYE